MTIVVSVVALCVVIILHELGHYLAAVATGMKVDRFSVFGIGPTIVRLGRFRGTEFTISAIPFGAYVLIRGMEPGDGEEREVDRRSSPNFRDKPLWARALVLLGGPGANYLAAMAILFGVFAATGVRGAHDRLVIQEFGKDSAAEIAGMQVGDALVAIDGQTIDPALGVAGINELTEPHRGETVDIEIARGAEAMHVAVALPTEGRALGVAFEPPPRHPVGVVEAASKAVAEPLEVTVLQLGGLWQLITGRVAADALQGPVGIVEHIAAQARTGLIPFLTTTAFISTLLGMFNLLPLPALDGGRLTFLAYEALARRRASARIEEAVHAYGMLALLVLIALVTVGDVRRMF